VGSPNKFIINAESEVVSSQTVKNFIDSYDRLNGYTGTYGYDVELSGYSKDIQAFQVPKHQAHNRTDLEPSFAKGKVEHLDKINKFIDKLEGDTSARQPLLIVCENDEQAREMYEAISKLRPNDQLQMVDSVKKDIEPETLIAGQKGMITIATPRMSRGTDINPNHESGLCVLTGYADFRRVEGQIQGRAGRQAAKGLTVQILDESDLRAKLETSTGQTITDSGKKLLKKYHQHLEQENLTSVQAKQLEGDLRQAFILFKQEGIEQDSLQKKENHKKWNKEFSDSWKDLTAKHSGNQETIKTELLEQNEGLAEKLQKVQLAKANRSMLNYEQELTKTQKPDFMLKDSDLKLASKASSVQANILSIGAKSISSERKISAEDVRPEYLEFWKQKFDRDSLRTLSPQERAVLNHSAGENFDIVKKNIIETIKDYTQQKNLSTTRKKAAKELCDKIYDTKNIGEIYKEVKESKDAQMKFDVENNSIFLNRKGSRFQELNANILDKIVVTEGKEYNPKEALESIKKLVSTLPDINKVSKNLKPLLDLQATEAETITKMTLVKGFLLQNMKSYNNTDKVLAKNIIHDIARVDLRLTKLTSKSVVVDKPHFIKTTPRISVLR